MSSTPALTRAEELELVKGLGCSFATAREGDYEPIVVMLDDFLVRVRRKLKAEFGNDWKEKTKNIRQRIRIQYDFSMFSPDRFVELSDGTLELAPRVYDAVILTGLYDFSYSAFGRSADLLYLMANVRG